MPQNIESRERAKGWARGIAPDAVNREVNDYYPTPREGTAKLCGAEQFTGKILEPACGDGAMARELAAFGYDVEAQDLVYRGFGIGGRDFLCRWDEADNIVTNPPFKLANEFMWHGMKLARRKLCLLGRLAWLEGGRRRMLYELPPPGIALARVHVFSERLTMQRGRLQRDSDMGGMISFAWFVFERGHKGPWQGFFL